MKTLELNQMEKLTGGGCKEDTISFGLAVTGIVVAALTGPFGWAAGFAIFSAGVSGASLVGSGNCF